MWFCVLCLLASAIECKEAPSVPQKVAAKLISAFSVGVRWRDPDLSGLADDSRFYVVRYRRVNEDIQKNDVYETVRTRGRRVKLLKLSPNTTYEIGVKVVKNGHSSPWSHKVQVTTSASKHLRYVVRNLTAIPVAPNAILLSWQPPEQANQVVAYTILTGLTRHKEPQRREVASNQMLEYIVGNLEPHRWYSFWVQTIQKNLPHPVSHEVQAQTFSDKPSGAPQDVMASYNGSNVTLSWRPPELHLQHGDITGYVFHYRCDEPTNSDINIVMLDKDVLEYSLIRLALNTACHVRVAANTVNGTGPFSVWQTVLAANSSAGTPAAARGSLNSGQTSISSRLMPTSSTIMADARFQHHDPTRLNSIEAGRPKIVFHEAGHVSIGGNTNLTCGSTGNEDPVIDWYVSLGSGVAGRRDQTVQVTRSNTHQVATRVQVVNNKQNNLVTSSLHLFQVKEGLGRDFLCVARNGGGTDRKWLHLEIDDPPRIMKSRGSSTTQNTTARLVCEASGRPAPTIVWIYSPTGAVYEEMPGNNRHRIHVLSHGSSSSRQSHLVFSSSNPGDAGPYICVAQSRAGRAQTRVVLQARVAPPGPVHKIQVIPLSPSRVSVSWLPPLNTGEDNVTYYEVSYRPKDGGQSYVYNATRAGTELFDLDPATEYLIGVTAGTSEGLGESGPEVEVRTLTNEGLQPANFSVKALNTSIIQLDWEPPVSVSPMYVRGYNVYSRREGEERSEKLFVRGSHSKQFLVGLGRDETYYLKISTLTTWGYEAFSSWIRIPKFSEGKLPPDKLVNVSAVANVNSINLTWQLPGLGQAMISSTNQIKGYKIVYGPVDDPENIRRAVLEAGARQFLISDLVPGINYIISLRAFNEFGDGDPVYIRTTTTIQVIPPSKVQKASAKPISSTEIHVQWEPPARGVVTQYHIRYWRPGHRDKQSAWLADILTNYVAGSLRKNSNYRFEIIPYNGDVMGDVMVLFSDTYGDKPDEPPANVTFSSFNSTTLVATWIPPDPERTNGEVTSYRLVLRTKTGSVVDSVLVHGSTSSYTFLNVSSTSTYKLRVAAVTINGTGVFSPWVETSQSPGSGKPLPPAGLSASPTETSLGISWQLPHSSEPQVDGYIVGYGQFIPEVFRKVLTSAHQTHTIKSLKPDTEYIVSVRAYNQRGESSPSVLLTKTYPVALPLSPVKVTVTSDSPTSLIVAWGDSRLADQQKMVDNRTYVIRYSPFSGETYQYINTSFVQHRLSDLQPATLYEISVKVLKGGNSSSWSIPVIHSTQETAPSSAPENITITSQPGDPTVVSLKWSEPIVTSGAIQEYVIYVTPDPSLDLAHWFVMRTEKTVVKIKHLVLKTSYFFKLQARNRAGSGPLSELVIYTPETAEKEVSPVNITVQGLPTNWSSTNVRVSWSMPERSKQDITGYLVFHTHNLSREATWSVQTERGLDTFITGLNFNTTYFFKVQARYSTTYGPVSQAVSFTTPPLGVNLSFEASGILKIQNHSSTDETSKDLFKIKHHHQVKDIIKLNQDGNINLHEDTSRQHELSSSDKYNYSSASNSPISFTGTENQFNSTWMLALYLSKRGNTDKSLGFMSATNSDSDSGITDYVPELTNITGGAHEPDDSTHDNVSGTKVRAYDSVSGTKVINNDSFGDTNASTYDSISGNDSVSGTKTNTYYSVSSTYGRTQENSSTDTIADSTFSVNMRKDHVTNDHSDVKNVDDTTQGHPNVIQVYDITDSYPHMKNVDDLGHRSSQDETLSTSEYPAQSHNMTADKGTDYGQESYVDYYDNSSFLHVSGNTTYDDKRDNKSFDYQYVS